MWPLLRLVFGLLLAAVLAYGALSTWTRANNPEPGIVSGVPARVPLAADKSLGVNTDLSRYDARAREQALTTMEAAGIRWLRQRFPWDRIESQPGIFDWAAWDEVVEAIDRHGLAFVAVLDGSPEWAQREADDKNRFAPPAEARDFGAFAASLAARYGDRIDFYQIWDEPNIAPHWGAREIDPAAYARLLREGAIQIRTADPGAVILAAALAPNTEPGGENLSDLLFLEALYQLGADEWFDVVAAQPYDFGEPADSAPRPDHLNWKRIALLREVMKDYGDGEAAVWAVSSGLTGDSAEAVTGVVTTAREDWPWLGPLFWAAWHPQDAHGDYALTGEDGRPRPVLDSIRALANTAITAWPGVYSADHPSGIYEGDWRVTPYGADIGASGDSLTIPFWGTRLDLTVRSGDYRSFLFATVDDQPANGLPRDSDGRAYVVLYDPLGEVQTVTLAHGLSQSDHVAKVIAERGWGQWAILGWTISRQWPESVPVLPLVLGFAAVLVLGFVLSRSWKERKSLVSTCNWLVGGYRAMDQRLALGATLAAAIIVYITVGLVPSLLALGVLGLLLLLRPEKGLSLIALALPFYQPGKPLMGKVFSMVEILTLLTTVGWAVNWAFGAWVRRLGVSGSESTHAVGGVTDPPCRLWSRLSRLTALDWGVIALVVLGAASLLWAEHGRVAAREYRTVILEAALFYGLLRVMVRKSPDTWPVTDGWVLGAGLIALVGVLQWAFGRNLITVDGVWRVRGFYGSPNNLALYLGRVLPLGLALGVWGHRRRRKWFYALAATAMVAAILLSYSRGAWLFGVPASLLFLAAMRGRRSLVIAAGALLLAATLVLLVAGPGRLTSLLDAGEGTTFFRLQLWESSWAMIRDHPILGVGLDNFLYHYRTHYVLPTAWEEFNLSHPHNVVFDFWLRLGLPGLIVFVWLLAAFFHRGWLSYRRLTGGDEQLLILGLLAGMVNVLAHGLVDNAFFLVDLAFAFMLMLAVVQVPQVQRTASKAVRGD
jgi:O-antigen ligase